MVSGCLHRRRSRGTHPGAAPGQPGTTLPAGRQGSGPLPLLPPSDCEGSSRFTAAATSTPPA